ncbi:MAG TPA: ATP-binding protein [Gemmatimonadales bacterium]|nr:ATP-binding protein [Gemmatimonadales bacterium]
MNDSQARAPSRHPRDEEFRLLVEAVKDYAILMLDAEGRVTSWNEGAERIKGYTSDEILGQSFTRFYPDEVVASGWPKHELEVAARDGRFEDEGWRVRKDGSRFWANVVITALRNSSGQLVGFGKVTRDLTARRKAEEQAQRLAAEEAAHAEAARRSEELARLNEQLEEQAVELEAQTAELETQTDEVAAQASQLERTNEELLVSLQETQAARQAAESALADLDQFAYVASHDLKAPLRGIANLTQWIQEDLAGGLPAESAEHMRLLQVRVQRMEALIDGILAYSRAGRAMRPVELVDTGALVKEVIELLAPPPHVRIRVAEHMPTVSAERVPLQQVFMNLIGNAVKHAGTGRDSTVIDLDWREVGDTIEFAVRDDGPGIAPEFQERIWGIFQTLAPRDKVEGTGVGLAVVKKIVETRGGRVSLDSTAGSGAVFRFSWPRIMREEQHE